MSVERGQTIKRTGRPPIPERDVLPEGLVTASGGRRRYFVCKASGQCAALDVVKDAEAIRQKRTQRSAWREVGWAEYLEYGRRHEGEVWLNGIYLSDATHTKLSRRLRARAEQRGKHLSLNALVEGIIAGWVEQHL